MCLARLVILLLFALFHDFGDFQPRIGNVLLVIFKS